MILLPSALCIELLKNKFTWLGQGRGVSSSIDSLVKNISSTRRGRGHDHYFSISTGFDICKICGAVIRIGWLVAINLGGICGCWHWHQCDLMPGRWLYHCLRVEILSLYAEFQIKRKKISNWNINHLLPNPSSSGTMNNRRKFRNNQGNNLG